MEGWMGQAACREVSWSVMVPTSDLPEAFERALGYCDGCPVVDECLEYAIRTRTYHGVFGGTDPKTRRRLMNRRARGVVPA